jgi:hypothetical protein
LASPPCFPIPRDALLGVGAARAGCRAPRPPLQGRN